MAEVSTPAIVTSFPTSGVTTESPRNIVADRLRNAKREAIEAALGKGESWCTKLLAGDSGVRLVDLPALLNELGLKVIDKTKYCVDRQVYESYRTIATKAMNAPQSLVWDEE
jgi:hypothetical protein